MFTNLSYANLPYWNQLPMTVTNYGGDTQVSTIPEYASSRIGMTMNPIAQQQFGMSMPSVQDLAQSYLNPAMNQMANTVIRNTQQAIAATKQGLNAALQKKDLKEEDKKKINDLLEQLKKQEEKLKELMQATETKPEDAFTKAQDIQNEVNKIKESANKLFTAINKGTSTDSTKTDNDDTKADDTTKADGDDSKKADGKTKTNDKTKADGKDEKQGASVDQAKITSLVDQFYDATYRVGTDDEAFNSVCEQITDENIIDVMLTWKKFHTTEKGESFMQTFMWDANSDQKKTYGKKIARALRDKAVALGIYDKCREDFATIDKEMNSWFYISNDVAKNYDNIIKEIANKEGKPYALKDFKY